jgi:hypothetical protein
VLTEGPHGKHWMSEAAFAVALADGRAERASAGGRSAAPAKAKATAKPKPSSARSTPAGIDQVKAAIAQERARIADVFASPASRGRERGCAALLASPKGWSAAEIVRELPHLPTDRQTAANRSAKRGDNVWSKVHNTGAEEAAGKPGGAVRPEGADPWARAYAAIGKGA